MKKYVENMKKYVKNMKKYVKNMKEYVKNMKKYDCGKYDDVEISRYIGSGSPLQALGLELSARIVRI